jgi:general secretion pathway protein K
MTPARWGDAVRGRDGIASLLVLWAMLLLGTLALSFSLAMRTEAQAARNGLDALRAYYQARSGVSRAVALLSALPPDNVLAMAIEAADGDAGYTVQVIPEGGKVDINAVPEAALKEILKKGGLDAERAEALGDAILDWRDPDDDRRPQGAEAADYAGLPEPLRPRNGKLATVEELQYVKGMDARFYDRFVSKVFTARNVGLAVDINTARVEVLRALPGISPEVAQAVLDRRKASRFGSSAEAFRFLLDAGVPSIDSMRFSTQDTSHAFTVVSVGKAAGNASRTVSCLVEIGGIGENPVRMVSWKDQVDADAE